MGAVYMAEQTEPVRRQVALKVIKLGMDTKEVVARFEAERQALALMEHPNIAQVYDAGATEQGRPYFVMELVQGTPLVEYCDQDGLPTRDRLELFMQVCRGVQHAHQKGVIHRDLKPSNIIVTMQDSTPTPKIIDFGIAKATGPQLSGEDRFTTMGQILGTPEYMSPEQADLSVLDIDTTTDIYSLGVILYELLTGELPFDGRTLRAAGIAGMQKILRDTYPPKPSTRLITLGEKAKEVASQRMTDPGALSRQLKGDLDWIVMKALEKDRSRRYEAASGFALDIQRHLDNEPVRARPPSTVYRLHKFVLRNRLGVSLAAALTVVLIAGMVGTAVGFFRAQREATKATAISTFLQDMLVSVDPDTAQGHEVTVRETLDAAAETVGTSFEDQPDVEAAIRETIGAMYTDLGHYTEAEPHLEQALEIRRTVLGEEGESTIFPLNKLAVAYFQQKRYEDAKVIWSQTLRSMERVYGKEHPDTLKCLGNLAAVYLAEKKFDEAEPLLVRVAEGRRKVLGAEDQLTISALNNLAQLYIDTDRFDKAQPLLVQALEARRKGLGDKHPRTLISTFNLADLYDETGRAGEAEPLYRQSFEGFRSVMGEDHPYTLLAMARMSEILLKLDRPEEAEPIALESHERHLERYGAGHEDTIEAARLLGTLYEALGDRPRAEEWRSKLPPDGAGSPDSH
jgi:tetratricopeptide (TPR) repeat protein